MAILNNFQDFLTAEAQRAQRVRSKDLDFHLGLLYIPIVNCSAIFIAHDLS
jgi:hypothetical protein